MIQNRQNNAFFRQLLFLGILITVGVIIFKQLAFFVGSFLGAITLYVVLRPLRFRMVDRWRWRPWLASLVSVTGASIIILVLGYVIFEMIASELPSLNTSKIMVGIDRLPTRINRALGYKLITDDTMSQLTSTLTGFFTSLLNTTYSFAANIFMMLVLLYFILANGRKMEAVLFTYLPFSGHSLKMLKEEFQTMIFSNAVGIPLVVLCQSATAALIYWALGFSNIVFWAFLTGLCGLIPMVGTLVVTLPLGIYLISGGEVWQGIAMILSGALVIANVDNLCRIVLMKKVANAHPLIVIFGVILGLPLFGFWGIIFGPLLLSGFLLLIKIYYIEYQLITPPPAVPDDGESPLQAEETK